MKEAGSYRTNPENLVDIFLQKMSQVEPDSRDRTVFTGEATHSMNNNDVCYRKRYELPVFSRREFAHDPVRLFCCK